MLRIGQPEEAAAALALLCIQASFVYYSAMPPHQLKPCQLWLLTIFHDHLHQLMH